MSIVKNHMNTAIVVVLEGEKKKNGKKGTKKIKYTRIQKDAQDEALQKAGAAIASLYKNKMMGVQKITVSELLEA